MKIQYALSELDQIAEQLLESWEHPILLFEAPMGAGKTTLIKALCEKMGIQEPVSSPTFSLVNSYRDHNENPVYHFDLYRLKNIEEALDIGIEEYLDSGYRCLIEWPDLIQSILSEPFQRVSIQILSDQERLLDIHK